MRPPISGTMIITQLFGGNPAAEAYQGSHGYLVIGHNGIDIGVPLGTDVYPAWNGIVTIVDSGNYGYGLHAIVTDIRGRQALYGHLSAVTVPDGSAVRIHTPFAKSGSSGYSTGPHIHFQVSDFPFNYANGYDGAHDPISGFDNDVVGSLDLSNTNL